MRFGFCDIENNQGLSKCYQPWSSARVITLALTFIILDITKTSYNNCLSCAAFLTILQLTQPTLILLILVVFGLPLALAFNFSAVFQSFSLLYPEYLTWPIYLIAQKMIAIYLLLFYFTLLLIIMLLIVLSPVLSRRKR